MRIASTALLCGLLVVSGLLTDAHAADQAPDFALKNMDGKILRFSKVNENGPVLISFWSTWCKNCPAEMKHFQRFYEKYKDQGLTLLAISIDTSKTVSKVPQWVKGRRLTCPVLLDTSNDVKRLFKVGPVPHTFLVDTSGKIVYSHVGYRAGDEVTVEKTIKELLAKAKTD